MANRMLRVFSTAVFAGVLLGSAFGVSAFRLTASPLFQGDLSRPMIVPMVVEVENSGPDARGVLKVSIEEKVTTYPVDLPRGARKRLVVYTGGLYSYEVHFSLQTDQGRLEKDATLKDRGVDGRNVLLFTDVPGELAFIVDPHSTAPGSSGPPGGPGQQQAPTLVDCYCKPGEGPTRPIGYLGVSTILLGSGSERLTDEEVAAIKLWMTTGGTLCFVGGVSAPVLSDHRWADVLPVQKLHLAELSHSAVLSGLGTGEAPTASITSGQVVEGGTAKMDGSKLVWSDKPHGFGKAIYISFNPFEAPMNKWDGRRLALTKILRSPETQSAESFLYGYGGSTTSVIAYRGGPPGGMPPGSPPPVIPAPATSIENDPFSMTLPPTARIGWILFGYLILVVPVNFLVLKKMKRGEMAWFTAPVISLAFAGVLFQSSRSLYSAKMSTASNGVIIAQEGDSEGIYFGNTQMFIPQAGSYDLGLNDVDSIGVAMDNSQYGGYSSFNPGSDQNKDLDPIDVGEMKVPALQAHNLAFERIVYRQKVPISKWLHLRLQHDDANSARCEITNAGTYTLQGAQLAVGRTFKDIGDLKPGEHKTISVSFSPTAKLEDIASNDIRMFTARRQRVALTGKLDGFRPGPQIGADVPGRDGVQIALFSAWDGGQP